MTEDKFVIDSSCVLEWIETGSSSQKDKARRIYELLRAGKVSAYAPFLLLVEVANVLFWKKKISIPDISEFIERVRDSGINFVDGVFGQESIEDILSLMGKYSITAYDAQYVYLAKKMNLRLVTFDEKLKEIKETAFDFASLSD